MSGMEAVAIIGTVAAVVSAFQHGDALVKRIKAKRTLKNKPLPPPALEQSLMRGPRAVNDAYESGVETYGTAFRVENDRIANDAFKDIIIQLQGSLLRHLVTAQEDDSVNDFGAVVDISNLGRVRSVTVLMEMYMRMAQAAPISNVMGRSGQNNVAAFDMSEWQRQQQQRMLPSSQGLVGFPTPGNDWTGHVQRSMTGMTSNSHDTQPARSTTDTTNSSRGPRPGRHMVRMMDGRQDGGSAAQQYMIPASNPHAQIPLSKTGMTDVTMPDQATRNEANDYANSTKRGGIRQLFSSPKPRNAAFNADDTKPPPINFLQPASSSSNSPGQHSPDGSSSPTSLGASPELSSDITPWQSSSPPLARTSKPVPKSRRAATSGTIRSLPQSPSKPKRKWYFASSHTKPARPPGSFCDGASLLQSGNDGLKLRNQSVSMTGQANYWACASSLCSFEGPAVKQAGKNGGWGFDDSIREAHGVRYRWSFLAKSHVTLSNSKDGYDFSCVFCAAKGERGAVVLRREGRFLQHVAQHQGEAPDRFKMGFFHYIVGRRALEQETFDVNLPAPFAAEQDPDPRVSEDGPGLGTTMGEEGISEPIEAEERTKEEYEETITPDDDEDDDERNPFGGLHNLQHAVEHVDSAETDIHPALRSPAPFTTHPAARVSVPDPWRASYVTLRRLDCIAPTPASANTPPPAPPESEQV